MSGSQRSVMLHFLGGTETVTGSRFLVDGPSARVLVDCGLFQGLKELRLRNWERFPIDAATIDAVVLTHAHVDHSAYLPALVRQGFSGRVFATAGTEALCRIVLPDTGHLQEEEAAYANRRGYSKHAPAQALFTSADAEDALGHFAVVEFDVPVDVVPGIRATWRPAGHILGAATIALEIDSTPKRTALFSGDLGRPHHPILRAPAPPVAADAIVIESTYGNRSHDEPASLEAFTAALCRTADRGGMAVIPAFAVDRTEVILFHLRQLIRAGRVPPLPVYVDSPMALAALGVYRDAMRAGSAEVRPQAAEVGDPFDPGVLHEVHDIEHSKALNDVRGPGVIISASGMATGGRVLHHLLHRLPDERNTVILPGYQAQGTRGRTLLDGASAVKLLGRYVPVRAEIVSALGFSVHADQGELLEWLRRAPRPPEMTFIVHGEPSASAALQQTVTASLQWPAVTPRYMESVRID